jgi:hypothetical protein
VDGQTYIIRSDRPLTAPAKAKTVPGGYGQMANRIVRNGYWRAMKGPSRDVYPVLVTLAVAEAGFVFSQSFSEIANQIGCSTKHVQRAIDELTGMKLIEVVTQGGMRAGQTTTSVYRLLFPTENAKAEPASVDCRVHRTRRSTGPGGPQAYGLPSPAPMDCPVHPTTNQRLRPSEADAEQESPTPTPAPPEDGPGAETACSARIEVEIECEQETKGTEAQCVEVMLAHDVPYANALAIYRSPNAKTHSPQVYAAVAAAYRERKASPKVESRPRNPVAWWRVAITTDPHCYHAGPEPARVREAEHRSESRRVQPVDDAAAWLAGLTDTDIAEVRERLAERYVRQRKITESNYVQTCGIDLLARATAKNAWVMAEVAGI